jgi:quercetin dioxygenase-like cupin family protein
MRSALLVRFCAAVALGSVGSVSLTLADDVLAKHAQVEVLTKTNQSWNGALLPHYTTGDPELLIAKVTIPVGAHLPLHEHPYATAGVLLEGEIVVKTPSGEQHRLVAGEALVELINQAHYGENTGDVDAVILVVYAGEKGKPVTVLLDPVSQDERPL